MDDRLELSRVEIEIYSGDAAAPQRFARTGPIWLGLICGLSFRIGRSAAGK
jgi:hypothetical protein